MKLGEPGPMRDRLVAAVLAGDKTATSALRAYYHDEGLGLPAAATKRQLLDSEDTPVATIEVTDARIMRMGDADMELAQAEGAGFDFGSGVSVAPRGVLGERDHPQFQEHAGADARRRHRGRGRQLPRGRRGLTGGGMRAGRICPHCADKSDP